MSRVLGVKKGFRFHEWNNRINRMSYDFVICDKAATVIAAIELDDKSHEREDRRESDAKKSKATTDAGLRLVRWHVKSPPDELTIQRELSANDASLGGATGIKCHARPRAVATICHQARVAGDDSPRSKLRGGC